jgi:paraquat-inducible protein A
MIRLVALRPVVALNMLLLILYPVSWLAPLARAGFLPYFSGTEITILGGVRDLWKSAPALAILVAAFAIAIPYGKALCLAAIHYGHLGSRALPLIEVIGKLSMADVFLIALYIVLVKGVGIGHVTSAWGLWMFTGCVLASIWIGFETKRKIGTWE